MRITLYRIYHAQILPQLAFGLLLLHISTQATKIILATDTIDNCVIIKSYQTH